MTKGNAERSRRYEIQSNHTEGLPKELAFEQEEFWAKSIKQKEGRLDYERKERNDWWNLGL